MLCYNENPWVSWSLNLKFQSVCMKRGHSSGNWCGDLHNMRLICLVLFKLWKRYLSVIFILQFICQLISKHRICLFLMVYVQITVPTIKWNVKKNNCRLFFLSHLFAFKFNLNQRKIASHSSKFKWKQVEISRFWNRY